MSKHFRNALAAGATVAALLTATAALACDGCRAAAPQGLLDYLFTSSASCSPCAAPAQPVVETPVVEAPCTPCQPATYQGDYMVQQRATYSGPAVIAPKPTYAPSPTASGYPYVAQVNNGGGYYADPSDPNADVSPAEPAQPMRRSPRRAVSRKHVNVRSDLPATKNKGVQVIRARAEVKIYGSKRMDIHLYRN